MSRKKKKLEKKPSVLFIHQYTRSAKAQANIVRVVGEVSKSKNAGDIYEIKVCPNKVGYELYDPKSQHSHSIGSCEFYAEYYRKADFIKIIRSIEDEKCPFLKMIESLAEKDGKLIKK